jgi:hypothetical protein
MTVSVCNFFQNEPAAARYRITLEVVYMNAGLLARCQFASEICRGLSWFSSVIEQMLELVLKLDCMLQMQTSPAQWYHQNFGLMHPIALHTSTMNVEAACISETSATLNISAWCKRSRTELILTSDHS